MNKEDIEKIKVLNSAMQRIIEGKFDSSSLRELSLNEDDPFYELYQNILTASIKLDESSHFVKDLGSGKLSTIAPNNNFIISYFKELHSDLKHLLWQIKEITKGDYSQTVYLMGDFSIEFSKLIDKLKENQYLKEELERSNAAKDKLFSIVAHDLKSPFNAILGFSELLIENYNMFSDDQKKEMIDNIYKSSKNTYLFLTNLLEWSRAQLGKIVLNKEPLIVSSLINSIINRYENSAQLKKISLVNNANTSTVMLGDLNTIEIALGNIINNDIKFTNIGGNIEFSTITRGEFVEINIKDNGVGMEQKVVNNLFSLENNSSTTGTSNEKGTGLGLLICYEFIIKNGGSIKVESELSVGTFFKVSLPLYKPES